MKNLEGKKILVNLIRNSTITKQSWKKNLCNLFLHFVEKKRQLEILLRKSNFEKDSLQEQKYLLESSLKDLEKQTDLNRTRKVFETMIYCLERPMKNIDFQIESLGIQIINPVKGDTFQPKWHEPVNESLSKEISRTLRRGYKYKGACLRPALIELEE